MNYKYHYRYMYFQFRMRNIIENRVENTTNNISCINNNNKSNINYLDKKLISSFSFSMFSINIRNINTN